MLKVSNRQDSKSAFKKLKHRRLKLLQDFALVMPEFWVAELIALSISFAKEQIFIF